MRLRLSSLRLRLRLLLFSAASFLLLVGTETHRRATRAREGRLLARIEALEALQNEKTPSHPTASTEISHARQIGDETNFFPRPRILGSGRSGPWVYLDVRLPSWETRRYYLRRSASRLERRRWIRSICADVEDDYYLLSLPSTATAVDRSPECF